MFAKSSQNLAGRSPERSRGTCIGARFPTSRATPRAGLYLVPGAQYRGDEHAGSPLHRPSGRDWRPRAGSDRL